VRYQFQMSIKFSIFFPNLTRFIFLQIEQVPLLEYRFGGTRFNHNDGRIGGFGPTDGKLGH